MKTCLHIVETRTSFLARASLHWHVQEHEAEEIVSSTCCSPSFAGQSRGEYIWQNGKTGVTTFDESSGLFPVKQMLTADVWSETFENGRFIPVLNRSNGNQGWLTFFPRNACTRTVSTLTMPGKSGERSLHTFQHRILQYHGLEERSLHTFRH